MNISESSGEIFEQTDVSQRKSSEKPKEKRRIRKESPPPLRPYGKKPWRTILTSFFLLFTGIFFVFTGVFRWPEHPWTEVLPFFVLGTLLLIPGVYHSFIIVMIWRGAEGYSYELLPAMED